MGRDNYISLITKQLNNQLSTSELSELNNWLSVNSGSKAVVSDFKEVWDSVSTYKSSASFDVDAAYNSFVKKYDIPISTPVSSNAQGGISNTLRYILAAITALLLIGGGVYLAKNGDTLAGSIEHFANNDSTSISVSLVGGGIATMAPQSEFNYNYKSSQVSDLKGESTFSLVKNAQKKPLNIDFDGLAIKANDTELAVNSDETSGDISTSVNKGRVDVEIGKTAIQLTKGQKLSYNSHTKKHKIEKSRPQILIDKAEGILSFDNTPIEEAFQAIEQFYDVNIDIVDSKVPAYHFTAINYRPESLDECLELIQNSFSMTILRKGPKSIVISNIKSK